MEDKQTEMFKMQQGLEVGFNLVQVMYLIKIGSVETKIILEKIKKAVKIV